MDRQNSTLSRKTIFKIVVLGESGVGKTSLLERYVTDRFSMLYKATIGADVMTKNIELENHRVVTLQLWDTAGQERFQSLGTCFYRGADCCILVYDVGIPQTFENLDVWRREFLLQAGIEPTQIEHFPFIVLGNKVDKEDRAVTRKMGETWCQQHGNLPYLECSAKDDKNVKTAFLMAAELIDSRRKETEVNQVDYGKIDLRKNAPTNGSGCC
ncbi:ras-related protein Rab-7 [Planoprotostelium fungivorum]|uniref:Ras-related protein Rab-7b n=1 Tax=Planoprotostelium fungivorum TaxID=1890364 RepID=A0A2P6P0Q2_9EUKA|nr:ras-related protein Rab-7 [Planoprotostelium fungivorum]